MRKTRRAENEIGCLLVVVIGAALLYLFVPQVRIWMRGVSASVQPPVDVQLTPFLFSKGYYVNVINTSTKTTLTSVSVCYGRLGQTKTQIPGSVPGKIGPGIMAMLDPTDCGWTVGKGETITVSASGYLPRTFDTDTLIGR